MIRKWERIGLASLLVGEGVTRLEKVHEKEGTRVGMTKPRLDAG